MTEASNQWQTPSPAHHHVTCRNAGTIVARAAPAPMGVFASVTYFHFLQQRSEVGILAKVQWGTGMQQLSSHLSTFFYYYLTNLSTSQHRVHIHIAYRWCGRRRHSIIHFIQNLARRYQGSSDGAQQSWTHANKAGLHPHPREVPFPKWED